MDDLDEWVLKVILVLSLLDHRPERRLVDGWHYAILITERYSARALAGQPMALIDEECTFDVIAKPQEWTHISMLST